MSSVLLWGWEGGSPEFLVGKKVADLSGVKGLMFFKWQKGSSSILPQSCRLTLSVPLVVCETVSQESHGSLEVLFLYFPTTHGSHPDPLGVLPGAHTEINIYMM